MAQQGTCTCPIHDQPHPSAGRRSVGVMIHSPQKQTQDQGVQTSLENDVYDQSDALVKLVSPVNIEESDESCRCEDHCRYMLPSDKSEVCSCDKCGARLNEKTFKVDRALQMPPVENRGVQTTFDAPETARKQWVTGSSQPHARHKVSESVQPQPTLTVSAEDGIVQGAVPPGARYQLQLVTPAQLGPHTPRSLPVEDVRVVLVPSHEAAEKPKRQDHLRSVEHGDRVEHGADCQKELRFWIAYVVIAVVLATVLLFLTMYTFETADSTGASRATHTFLKVAICSACALVLTFAFYLMWVALHFDQRRGLTIMVAVSAVGLVGFSLLAVLSVWLAYSAAIFPVLMFMLAVVFLVACAHCAIALSRLLQPPPPTALPV